MISSPYVEWLTFLLINPLPNIYVLKDCHCHSQLSEIFSDIYRSRQRRCSKKKVFFKISQYLQGKRLCWSLFLIKLQAWAYFEEYLWTGNSKFSNPKINFTSHFYERQLKGNVQSVQNMTYGPWEKTLVQIILWNNKKTEWLFFSNQGRLKLRG